jgi:lipoprotein-anchoring transpeptidase ErfK/SrfK
MARELRPLFLLPIAFCALAASLVLQRPPHQPKGVAGVAWAPAKAPDRWRAPAAYPKARPVQPQPVGHLVAYVRPGHAVAVRARPNGEVLASLGSRTEFGSSRALSVVRERRGRWLGVTTPNLPNGKLGWVDAWSGGLRYTHAPVALEIDLSRRQLVVRRGDEVLRRAPVSIGRAGSPTPTGRFAVTDKLPGQRFSAAYGCCILALSGTQPNLPAGWTGGNRLAIHGTPDEGSVGGRESAGCLQARESDLRPLMKSIPLGTPVRIHA